MAAISFVAASLRIKSDSAEEMHGDARLRRRLAQRHHQIGAGDEIDRRAKPAAILTTGAPSAVT